MVSKKPLNPEEITDLLSKLKAETPEYPSEMMAARKAAFLKQAVNIKIDLKDQGGNGGQQGGGSGSAGGGLGGGAVAPGTLLQALIGISIVTAMFLAAYAYRKEISGIIKGDEVTVQEDTSVPVPVSSPLAPEATGAAPGFVAPELVEPPLENIATGTPIAEGDTNLNGALLVGGTPGIESASDDLKTNSGLHLGQTPGTPAAPGHGNPGNPNQPDKPDKPEKPEKPTKPPKKK